MKRREFVNKTAAATALGAMGLPLNINALGKEKKMQKTIKIKDTNSNFERESLFPYRFKGSAVTQL